jgi:hypothetical protein
MGILGELREPAFRTFRRGRLEKHFFGWREGGTTLT